MDRNTVKLSHLKSTRTFHVPRVEKDSTELNNDLTRVGNAIFYKLRKTEEEVKYAKKQLLAKAQQAGQLRDEKADLISKAEKNAKYLAEI